MEYKTIPFAPVVKSDTGAQAVASELATLISRYATDGWEFMGLENHFTSVMGSKGCFGFGAQPPYNYTFSVAVFRR